MCIIPPARLSLRTHQPIVRETLQHGNARERHQPVRDAVLVGIPRASMNVATSPPASDDAQHGYEPWGSDVEAENVIEAVPELQDNTYEAWGCDAEGQGLTPADKCDGDAETQQGVQIDDCDGADAGYEAWEHEGEESKQQAVVVPSSNADGYDQWNARETDVQVATPMASSEQNVPTAIAAQARAAAAPGNAPPADAPGDAPAAICTQSVAAAPPAMPATSSKDGKDGTSVAAPEAVRMVLRHGSQYRHNNAVSNPMSRFYWNERFKFANAMPSDTESQRRRRYRELTALKNDFVAVATTHVKVLVQDKFIPAATAGSAPTFREAAVGGIAGGFKYIQKGILFKLSTGTSAPYCRAKSLSPDEAAAKAAGHDLRGATHFAKVGAVEVALMSVIDYRGFRIVAQALLPIDPPKSLELGSGDGGRTVLSGDTDVLVAFEQTARQLGLAKHGVALGRRGVAPQRNCPSVYFGVDVEGHRGLDGQIYGADFARTFPCEAPHEASHLRLVPPKTIHYGPGEGAPHSADSNNAGGHDRLCVFWRMLRPEFVKSCLLTSPAGTLERFITGAAVASRGDGSGAAVQDVREGAIGPLSPDAMTAFCAGSSDAAVHNARIVRATRSLMKRVAPAVTTTLIAMMIARLRQADADAGAQRVRGARYFDQHRAQRRRQRLLQRHQEQRQRRKQRRVEKRHERIQQRHNELQGQTERHTKSARRRRSSGGRRRSSTLASGVVDKLRSLRRRLSGGNDDASGQSPPPAQRPVSVRARRRSSSGGAPPAFVRSMSATQKRPHQWQVGTEHNTDSDSDSASDGDISTSGRALGWGDATDADATTVDEREESFWLDQTQRAPLSFRAVKAPEATSTTSSNTVMDDATSSGDLIGGRKITQVMHRHGLNVRHMGLVRGYLKQRLLEIEDVPGIDSQPRSRRHSNNRAKHRLAKAAAVLGVDLQTVSQHVARRRKQSFQAIARRGSDPLSLGAGPSWVADVARAGTPMARAVGESDKLGLGLGLASGAAVDMDVVADVDVDAAGDAEDGNGALAAIDTDSLCRAIEQLRAELLTEMVARTVKNLLRRYSRELLKEQQQEASDYDLHRIFRLVLNQLTAAPSATKKRAERGKVATSFYANFWKDEVPTSLRLRFGHSAISDKEAHRLHVAVCGLDVDADTAATVPDRAASIAADVDILSRTLGGMQQCLSSLLKRIIEMMRAKLEASCEMQLFAAPLRFELRTTDILDLSPRVKHLSSLDYAEGALMALSAHDTRKKNDFPSAARLYASATSILRRQLHDVHDDPKALAALAETTLRRALMLAGYTEVRRRGILFRFCGRDNKPGGNAGIENDGKDDLDLGLTLLLPGTPTEAQNEPRIWGAQRRLLLIATAWRFGVVEGHTLWHPNANRTLPMGSSLWRAEEPLPFNSDTAQTPRSGRIRRALSVVTQHLSTPRSQSSRATIRRRSSRQTPRSSQTRSIMARMALASAAAQSARYIDIYSRDLPTDTQLIPVAHAADANARTVLSLLRESHRTLCAIDDAAGLVLMSRIFSEHASPTDALRALSAATSSLRRLFAGNRFACLHACEGNAFVPAHRRFVAALARVRFGTPTASDRAICGAAAGGEFKIDGTTIEEDNTAGHEQPLMMMMLMAAFEDALVAECEDATFAAARKAVLHTISKAGDRQLALEDHEKAGVFAACDAAARGCTVAQATAAALAATGQARGASIFRQASSRHNSLDGRHSSAGSRRSATRHLERVAAAQRSEANARAWVMRRRSKRLTALEDRLQRFASSLLWTQEEENAYAEAVGTKSTPARTLHDDVASALSNQSQGPPRPRLRIPQQKVKPAFKRTDSSDSVGGQLAVPDLSQSIATLRKRFTGTDAMRSWNVARALRSLDLRGDAGRLGNDRDDGVHLLRKTVKAAGDRPHDAVQHIDSGNPLQLHLPLATVQCFTLGFVLQAIPRREVALLTLPLSWQNALDVTPLAGFLNQRKVRDVGEERLWFELDGDIGALVCYDAPPPPWSKAETYWHWRRLQGTGLSTAAPEMSQISESGADESVAQSSLSMSTPRRIYRLEHIAQAASEWSCGSTDEEDVSERFAGGVREALPGTSPHLGVFELLCMGPGNDDGRGEQIDFVGYEDKLSSDVVHTELRAEGHGLPTTAVVDEHGSEAVTTGGGDAQTEMSLWVAAIRNAVTTHRFVQPLGLGGLAFASGLKVQEGGFKVPDTDRACSDGVETGSDSDQTGTGTDKWNFQDTWSFAVAELGRPRGRRINVPDSSERYPPPACLRLPWPSTRAPANTALVKCQHSWRTLADEASALAGLLRLAPGVDEVQLRPTAAGAGQGEDACLPLRVPDGAGLVSGTMVFLDLSASHLDSASLALIAALLQHNPSLMALNLSRNRLLQSAYHRSPDNAGMACLGGLWALSNAFSSSKRGQRAALSTLESEFEDADAGHPELHKAMTAAAQAAIRCVSRWDFETHCQLTSLDLSSCGILCPPAVELEMRPAHEAASLALHVLARGLRSEGCCLTHLDLGGNAVIIDHQRAPESDDQDDMLCALSALIEALRQGSSVTSLSLCKLRAPLPQAALGQFARLLESPAGQPSVFARLDLQGTQFIGPSGAPTNKDSSGSRVLGSALRWWNSATTAALSITLNLSDCALGPEANALLASCQSRSCGEGRGGAVVLRGIELPAVTGSAAVPLPPAEKPTLMVAAVAAEPLMNAATVQQGRPQQKHSTPHSGSRQGLAARLEPELAHRNRRVSLPQMRLLPLQGSWLRKQCSGRGLWTWRTRWFQLKLADAGAPALLMYCNPSHAQAGSGEGALHPANSRSISMRGRTVMATRTSRTRSGENCFLFTIGPVQHAAQTHSQEHEQQRSPSRSYVLSAQSIEQRQAWIEVLRKAARQ